MNTRTIDTNVLVRLLLKDESEQWQQVAELADRFRFVVLPTVVLEAEWILRSRFGLGRDAIAKLFRSILVSDRVVVTESARIARSLDCFERGMDFADAMHVCLMEEGQTFITFDRDLVRLAHRHIDSVSVELAH